MNCPNAERSVELPIPPLLYDANGDPIGCQTPRYFYGTDGDPSPGEDAIELAYEFGVELDDFQQLILREGLRERPEDGKWSAAQVGLVVSRQNGKALDAATPILTTEGWSTMGDLRVGDEIFAADGHPTRVVGVFDQPSGRCCYEVTTTDGRSLVADGEHLWTVRDARKQSGGWETLTTKELLARGLVRSGSECAFRMPNQRAIMSKPTELPIDPYLLGVWLGDGGSRDSRLAVGRLDHDEMIENIVAAGARIVSEKLERTAWHVFFNIEGARFGDGFTARAKRLNLIKNKHVPAVYLTAGTEQRLALLQGLLDTDGSISTVGRVEFCATNRRLADAALYLARSLGWRATLRVGRAKLNGRDCGEKFRVCFTPQPSECSPFRLRRKAERVREHPMAGRGRQAVSIKSIEPVESRNVRCIKIDREDGLFLAGRDLMVTHNTEVLLAIELAGLLLWGEERILHSAQLFQTAVDAKDRLDTILARRPDLVKYKAVGTHGAEKIEITSGPNKGACVTYQTRTTKGGLGLPVDRVIFDEAMFISPQSYQALRPTLSARPNAQIWLTGSAVDQRAHDGCEQFAGLRHRGLTSPPGERFCYIEWSVPEDADPSSPETWARANPALGKRITVEFVQDEYKDFISTGGSGERGFALMRLGIGDWPTFGSARSEIPLDRWVTFRNADTEFGGEAIVVLYRSPEGGPWTLSAARRTADDRIHIEIGYFGSDPANLVIGRLVDAVTAWGVSTVIVGRGAASDIIPQLESVGINPVVPSLMDEAQACGGFLNDSFADGAPVLSHGDQPALNNGISNAIRRELPSGGFVWDAVEENSYSQLMAATLARWGLVKFGGNADYQFIFEPPSDEEIDSWISEDFEAWLNDDSDE